MQTSLQLSLVDTSAALRVWARGLSAQLGFALGDPIPLADPAFLGLVAQALWPRDRLEPADWVSAAELLDEELGREVIASEHNLAAAALALQVAAAATAAFADRSGAGALAELDRVWSRTAELLAQSVPHRPAAQRRLIARALGDRVPGGRGHLRRVA